jgi:hypothetical protein
MSHDFGDVCGRIEQEREPAHESGNLYDADSADRFWQVHYGLIDGPNNVANGSDQRISTRHSRFSLAEDAFPGVLLSGPARNPDGDGEDDEGNDTH